MITHPIKPARCP